MFNGGKSGCLSDTLGETVHEYAFYGWEFDDAYRVGEKGYTGPPLTLIYF